MCFSLGKEALVRKFARKLEAAGNYEVAHADEGS